MAHAHRDYRLAGCDALTMGQATTRERAAHNYVHGKSNPRLLALLQSQLPSWEQEERELNALLRKQRESA